MRWLRPGRQWPARNARACGSAEWKHDARHFAGHQAHRNDSLTKQTRSDCMSAIRVVIAEDQTMVLGALAALLELDGDIKVVAQAKDGKLALAAVKESRPDVLISDIEMPNMT